MARMVDRRAAMNHVLRGGSRRPRRELDEQAREAPARAVLLGGALRDRGLIHRARDLLARRALPPGGRRDHVDPAPVADAAHAAIAPSEPIPGATEAYLH